MAGQFDKPTSADEEIIDAEFKKVENDDEIITVEFEPREATDLKPRKTIEGKERKGLPAPEGENIPEVKSEKLVEVIDKKALERQIDSKKAEQKSLETELKDLADKIKLLKDDNEQLFEDAKDVGDALSYMEGTSPIMGMLDSDYRKAKAIVKKALSKPEYLYYRKDPRKLVEKSRQTKSDIFKLEDDLKNKDRDYKWKMIDLKVEIEKLEQKLASVDKN